MMFFFVKVRLGCFWELKKLVKEVLGDEMIMTDYEQKIEDITNTLLEHKNIVNATKAYEVSKETKCEAAWMAARLNLLMVMIKAKTSYFLGLPHLHCRATSR